MFTILSKQFETLQIGSTLFREFMDSKGLVNVVVYYIKGL